ESLTTTHPHPPIRKLCRCACQNRGQSDCSCPPACCRAGSFPAHPAGASRSSKLPTIRHHSSCDRRAAYPQACSETHPILSEECKPCSRRVDRSPWRNQNRMAACLCRCPAMNRPHRQIDKRPNDVAGTSAKDSTDG